MYYISQNKVYVDCPKGFREVKVTKDEEGKITIEPLKEVDSVKVEFICTLDEIVARYACGQEAAPEEVEKPKKEVAKTDKRIMKK